MPPVQLTNEDGQVFRTGKNLRVIQEYARTFKYDTTKLRQRGKTLIVMFPEGSRCETPFADATVLRDWIADRVRFGRGRFAFTDGRTA